MADRGRALLGCALVALAGCNLGGDVPKERLPSFVPAAAAPRVALVLGSGGPRGFAHIGVLKVLEDNGIRPDLIVGSSVGSMVGALYASGMSARDIERLAYELNILDFFEFGMVSYRPANGTPIQTYVNKLVKDRTIEQLPIPFAAAATRVADSTLIVFNHGDTGLAVRASSASAPQFAPVRVGDAVYTDSDDLSPVPIRIARSLHARVVIGVDVSAFADDTPPGVPQEWVAKDARRARQVAAEAGEADVLLHPNIGYYAGHNEAYRRRVIAAAEKYTLEKLPAIRAALARAGVVPAQAASARNPVGEASR
jgi:NTE family protein